MAEPWEQQDGESAAAFSAFRAYRDLGPGRSVVEAYRQSTGKAGAEQASGTWNSWATSFDWAGRAKALDQHLDAARVEGAEGARRGDGERWARRELRQRERQYRASLTLRKKALALVSGEKVGGIALRRVAAVLKAADEMANAAIASALGKATEQQSLAQPFVFDPAILEEVARCSVAWRASKGVRIGPPPGVEAPAPQGDSPLPQSTGGHAGGGGGPQDTRAAPV